MPKRSRLAPLKAKTIALSSLFLLLLFVPFFTVGCCVHYNPSNVTVDHTLFTPAYLTTRRDAIVDYVKALQAPEGYFHAYLQAPPPFDLDGTPAGLGEALDAYYTLEQIDRITSVDWNQTKEFLATLVDRDTGLLNLTKYIGPSTVSCLDAVTFYADIGLGYLFDVDTIAEFAASFQHPSGGFYLDSVSTHPDLLGTYCGVCTLQEIGRMDLMDIQKAKEFVESCYDESGWYADAPGGLENIFITPAGIILSDILGISNEDKENATAMYLMQNWDNIVGADSVDETLYTTERILWSLDLLNRKELIDTDKMFVWVLNLQKHWNGAFVGYPEASLEQERLVFAKYATHILSMYDGISLLDEDFSVVEEPVWEIPQWWIDYINSEWSTTTTHDGNHGYFVWPDLSVILGYLPAILLISIICIPAILVVAWTRNERMKKRQIKKDRKNRRKGKATW